MMQSDLVQRQLSISRRTFDHEVLSGTSSPSPDSDVAGVNALLDAGTRLLRTYTKQFVSRFVTTRWTKV